MISTSLRTAIAAFALGFASFTVPLRAQVLYALDQTRNAISANRIHPDGSVTPIGSPLPVAGRPSSLAVVSGKTNYGLASKFVYVLKFDGNSRPSISSFSIASDGALTYIGSTIVPNNANGLPICITSDPTGRFLYVGWYTFGVGTLYNIASDGSLTLVFGPLSASSSGRVYSMVVEPTGRFLYALFVDAGSNASIGSYSIGSDGVLTPIGLRVNARWGYPLFAMDPIGGFIFRPGLSQNTIDPGGILGFAMSSTGSLAQTSATPPTFPPSVVEIAVDAEGRFLFAVTTVSGSSYVQVYDISVEGGLTPLTTRLNVSRAGALASDPTGRFLFKSQGDGIVAYRILANGALTPSNLFPTDVTPNRFAITTCNVGAQGSDLCHADGYAQQQYRFVSLTGGNIYSFASAKMLSDDGTVIGTVNSTGDAAIFTRHSGVIMPGNVLEFNGINGLDDVVGTTTGDLPFVSSPPYDSLIDLSTVFGWTFGTATAINDRGDIVGSGNVPTITGASPFTFDTWFPSLNITNITTINNGRQVIGESSGPGNVQHYLFTPGPGARPLPDMPIALNNRGHILFASGDTEYIQTPSVEITLPSGFRWTSMNDSDEVVGFSTMSSAGGLQTVKPVYFSPSTGLVDLSARVVNPESYSQITPVAINNNGEIAVNYSSYIVNPKVAPNEGVGLLEPVPGSASSMVQTSAYSPQGAIPRHYTLNEHPLPVGVDQGSLSNDSSPRSPKSKSAGAFIAAP